MLIKKCNFRFLPYFTSIDGSKIYPKLWLYGPGTDRKLKISIVAHADIQKIKRCPNLNFLG